MKLFAAPLNFRDIATEYRVPTDFDPALREEAARAEDRYVDARRDARDIPLVTIDPVGSKDLDQAVYIEATGGADGPSGYTVVYAIADVAAFVAPGSALEEESLRRGQTIYLPDEPARLHPPEISEGKGSLLPDVDRPCVLWTFHLDGVGEVEDFHVERALVRSRARLDYDGVQADLERGAVHPSIALLPEVGKLRQESALRRQAVNVRLPSQRVVESDQGGYELIIEPRHEVMDYNSEISLLTGMCAGQLMQSRGEGLLRTLRPASEETESQFRAEAQALGFEIGGRSIGEFLLSVDADTPRGMALMRETLHLLRGADYARVGSEEEAVHAGIGGYYAHVTAPLRRLVDRFATEVCLALANDQQPPQWVLERIDAVLESMRRTTQLASTVDKACLNLTEATVLQPWVGENFHATILTSDAEKNKARIFVPEPPVLANCVGAPQQGGEETVSLVKADTQARDVLFAWPAD